MSVSARAQMTALIPGLGAEGVSRLAQAKVLVVGAGGLGSPVLFYLAAAGVGTLGISDPDQVAPSNLNRQILHTPARIGRQKSDSAQQTIAEFNPELNYRQLPGITAQNAHELLSDYELIVDASDNFETKYLLSDTCQALKLPLVWGTLVGLQFQVSMFAHGVYLRDLFPSPPRPGQTATSAEQGVLGAVCGQAGSIMATEVIKWFTGCGQPLTGKVLVADAAQNTWHVLPFTS